MQSFIYILNTADKYASETATDSYTSEIDIN